MTQDGRKQKRHNKNDFLKVLVLIKTSFNFASGRPMKTYGNITQTIYFHESYDFSCVFTGIHRLAEVKLKEALSKTTTFSKLPAFSFFFDPVSTQVPPLTPHLEDLLRRCGEVLKHSGSLGKLWKASKRVHGVLNTSMLPYRLYYRCPMQSS